MIVETCFCDAAAFSCTRVHIYYVQYMYCSTAPRIMHTITIVISLQAANTYTETETSTRTPYHTVVGNGTAQPSMPVIPGSGTTACTISILYPDTSLFSTSACFESQKIMQGEDLNRSMCKETAYSMRAQPFIPV